MAYLSLHEAFHGYTQAIVACVYTDAITVSAVKKDNHGMTSIATAEEPMGDTGAEEGMMPVDIVLFNMEKAIMALPADVRTPGTVVIVAVGPGTGSCTYMTAIGKRDAEDRKITAEELRMVIDSVNTEKGNEGVYKNYQELFSIDGFSVVDPIGVNGKEIAVGMVRTSCESELEKECVARFATLGLQYGGVIDMRHAAMHAEVFFEKTTSALLLFVFEHETYITIVRDGVVRASGAARGGYGILYADIAGNFAVGTEEAKAIVRAYHKQELDEGVSVTVENTCVAAAKKTVDAVKDAIARIDSENIIPGNIHVVSAHAVPEIMTQFISGDWLADLPVERNASISSFPENAGSGFLRPFDFLSADFLIR